MSITVGDLKIIASNGGGMVIDAKAFSPGDLKIIASNARDKRAMILLRNASCLSADDLKIIASNAKGAVIFDFVS